MRLMGAVIARSDSDEAIHSSLRLYGLLRGACHRARIRATRWLAMTERRVTPAVHIRSPIRSRSFVAPRAGPSCADNARRDCERSRPAVRRTIEIESAIGYE